MFSLPGAERTKLTDPYEIAYLAGGAPRCAQVAVVKLITCGAVDWKRTTILRESRLVAGGSAEAGFNVLCSVALFGAASGLDPSLAGIDSALRKDISHMGKNTGSSGGCGGATGCGGGSSGCSSGGGGSGCGGCGGGD
jgi:uncharacterized membrane protein YgcG